MIHVHVARSIISYAVTYGPRAYGAYKAANRAATMKRGADNFGSRFRQSGSGTVPTSKEWWQ